MLRSVRLPALALLAAIGFGPIPGAHAQQAPATTTALSPDQVEAMMADKIIGKPDAPITIVEYFSLTCPHCAEFHERTLPALKAKWLDTGKAKLVLREYPFDRLSLKATLLARCAQADRYVSVIDQILAGQRSWLLGARSEDDATTKLIQIARQAGLSAERSDACLASEALAARIIQNVQDASEKYRIDSTPTFIINDGAGRVVGAQAPEAFDKALEALAKP